MAGNDPIWDTAKKELSSNRGLAIGDAHGDVAIPEWMEKHLKDFREAGVKTLYMEMFAAGDQRALDDFMSRKPGADAKLVSVLESHWEYSAGSGAAYFTLVKEARDAGIRVVGIDVAVAKGASQGNDAKAPSADDDRLKVNPKWQATIEADAAARPGEKFLVYAGGDHTARTEFENTYKATGADGITSTNTETIPKGIDALLAIPSIDFDKYRGARAYGQPFETPTAMAIAATKGPGSSYEAELPRSTNQRDPRDGEVTPAAAYTLPPELQAELKKLSGLKLDAGVDPATVTHGLPASVNAPDTGKGQSR